MREITAGALMAILAITAAPAYAQTNTELLRDLEDAVTDIADGLNGLVDEMGSLAGEIRLLLDRFEDILPTIESNSESIRNIEAAMMGQVCGDGTTPVGGMCEADIRECDAEIVDGVCLAGITCGEGTLLHVDTCIADVSISYCGEGTVFAGGVCVAASQPTAPTPTAPTTQPAPGIPSVPEPGPPQPTIVEEEMTNRYIMDGDTIRVEVDGLSVSYNLAFSTTPGLSEPGGREAVQYLAALCGTSPITVDPETTPSGIEPRAVIQCGDVDASQAMVLTGHSSFDAADCSIRDFVNVGWTQERCMAAAAATPAPTTPTTTTPTTPTTPTTTDPPAEAPVEPVRGSLAYQDFTFPVTVGDVLQWQEADDGDPRTVAAISCLFTHTPNTVDAVIADNSGGVYDINTNPTYDDGNRHDTHVTMTAPRYALLFDQQFSVGDSSVVYDRSVEIIDIGPNDANYLVSMSISDWDDAAFADAAMPTQAERDQKLLDIEFSILTDIVNNDCTMSMTGVPAGERTEYTELLAIAANPGSNVLLDLIPHDVACSESITVTGINADATVPFLTGYDVIHVHDNEAGSDKDDTIGNAIGEPALSGLSFVSADFTVALNGDNPSRIAPVDRDEVRLDGVALMSVTYMATSDDVCTWTERTG